MAKCQALCYMMEPAPGRGEYTDSLPAQFVTRQNRKQMRIEVLVVRTQHEKAFIVIGGNQEQTLLC